MSEGKPTDDGTVKAIVEATRDFGGFLKEVFGPSVKDVGDVAHFHTHLWRVKNAIKLKEKMERLVRERGLNPDDIAELRVGIPILESALEEDDDRLQEMWAGLLATERKEGTKKSYVITLKSFDPEDADTLNWLIKLLQVTLTEGQQTWVKLGGVQAEMVATWDSLAHLEQLGIVRRKQPLETPDSEEDFMVVFATKQEGKKELDILAECRVAFTMYGYGFASALLGAPLIQASDGSEVRIADWDEYRRPKLP